MTQEHSDLVESNHQYIEMMSAFARRCPDAKIERLPGVTVMLSGTAFSMLNIIAISSPVRDAADLAERCGTAIVRGNKSGQPWFLSLCDAWAGDPEAAHEVLTGLGFKISVVTTGMVTSKLLPPRLPAPDELEIRRVRDEETRKAVSDLNCMSYGVALELGRATIGSESFWGDSFFGQVGFVDGDPVACAMAAPMDGRLYVSCVATHPEHRRRGYAEAVMRRSLENAASATDLQRTVLHATDMGRPLYVAMGYRPVGRFCLYMPAPVG